MRCSKNASKKTANGSISLPQETRKILNKKFHFIPRESRKQRTNETPNQYKEGNMISVKQRLKKQQERAMTPRAGSLKR